MLPCVVRGAWLLTCCVYAHVLQVDELRIIHQKSTDEEAEARRKEEREHLEFLKV